ncbi:hypothetical protein HBA54_09205 [Pelagibius litoralis]|uniref:Uncharacterized protein n=1 Tax=Pelagibius litoralis TaxID=374515 RepID=A0A967C903_9PROT|nr:hypothetical protein [Pelagibius litoralis]NIA68767.1 hypothetical protein [Pelagibius litoralis]
MPVSAPATKKFEIPVWLQPDGAPLSCREKIKVLNENLEEIREMAQDALEDGILMGGDEAQLRDVLLDLVRSLENPYRDRKP